MSVHLVGSLHFLALEKWPLVGDCLCIPGALLPVSMSPHCLLPLQEALQDQSVSLTQVSFKLLLLLWGPEHVKFCVHPLGVEFLFPTDL